MKTLVTVPEEVVEEMESFIKVNYPHMKIGKYLVHAGLEKMKKEIAENLETANKTLESLK